MHAMPTLHPVNVHTGTRRKPKHFRTSCLKLNLFQSCEVFSPSPKPGATQFAQTPRRVTCAQHCPICTNCTF